MPIKNYDSVKGQIQGENASGLQIDYLIDALGSVVGTVDEGQAVLNTYRYKPYGELLARSGIGVDPRYLWTGGQGSRATDLDRAEQYNRARHYNSIDAGWITVDPLWPEELAFVYANSSPVLVGDPSGMSVFVNECPCMRCKNGKRVPVPPPVPIKPIVKGICNLLQGIANQPVIRRKVRDCIAKTCDYDHPLDMTNCIMKFCSSNATVKCDVWCDDACAYASPFVSPCHISVCTRETRQYCDVPKICGYNEVASCYEPLCFSESIDTKMSLLHEVAHCCGLGPDGGIFGGNQEVGNCIAYCVIYKGDW